MKVASVVAVVLLASAGQGWAQANSMSQALDQAAKDIEARTRHREIERQMRRQADALESMAARDYRAEEKASQRRQVGKLIGEGDCGSAKRLAAAYADLDLLQQTTSICGPLEK